MMLKDAQYSKVKSPGLYKNLYVTQNEAKNQQNHKKS